MKITKLTDKIQAIERRRDHLAQRIHDSARPLYYDRAELEALHVALELLKLAKVERDGGVDARLVSLMADGSIDHPVEVVKLIVAAYDGPQTPEGNRAHTRAIEQGRRLITRYDGPG